MGCGQPHDKLIKDFAATFDHIKVAISNRVKSTGVNCSFHIVLRKIIGESIDFVLELKLVKP
tara:strand:- start:2 stop:187 length:186 start_codon:yes stop_codon:yes gene_type:complete